MKNDEIFMRKIDYSTVLLRHIDRILDRINKEGVDQRVEYAIDFLWNAITDEYKKNHVEEWNEVNKLSGKNLAMEERKRIGKERASRKFQLIMNILGERGILYRSVYEEQIQDEIEIVEGEDEN